MEMYSSSGEQRAAFPPSADLLSASGNAKGFSPALPSSSPVPEVAAAPSDAPSTARLVRPRLGAYELKFLVPDDIADELLTAIRPHLSPDPHAEPGRAPGAVGESYRIHSLYLDTPRFDVFRRIGSNGRRKFRLRRYGDETQVWAERKSKTNGRVVKRRSAIDPAVLPGFASGELPGKNGGPHEPAQPQAVVWFQRRIQRRQLQPVCQIAYRRIARVGQGALHGLRFTVDRGLQGQLSDRWELTPWQQPLGLLSGQSIVEMKFPEAMPDLFKQLMARFELVPQAISKYRWMLQALLPAANSG